jgi:hypothetical protein
MSFMDDFNEIINKPMEALEKDRRGRIAFERLNLAKFVVKMHYKYGKDTKTIMDDIEIVMRRYGGEKV